MQCPAECEIAAQQNMRNVGWWIPSADFTPDGTKVLAAGTRDPFGHFTIKAWDVESGETYTTFTNLVSTVEDFHFSPSGLFIAGGD